MKIRKFENFNQYVSPDDIVISSNGFKYSIGSQDHGFLGENEDYEKVIEIIEEWCELHNWYPDIWLESDHGNLDGPYSLEQLK